MGEYVGSTYEHSETDVSTPYCFVDVYIKDVCLIEYIFDYANR